MTFGFSNPITFFTLQIEFDAIRGTNRQSDIAIDDITLYPFKCNTDDERTEDYYEQLLNESELGKQR